MKFSPFTDIKSDKDSGLFLIGSLLSLPLTDNLGLSALAKITCLLYGYDFDMREGLHLNLPNPSFGRGNTSHLDSRERVVELLCDRTHFGHA